MLIPSVMVAALLGALVQQPARRVTCPAAPRDTALGGPPSADSLAGRYALTVVRTRAGVADRVAAGVLVLDRRHAPIQRAGSPVTLPLFGVVTVRPATFYEASAGRRRRDRGDTLYVRLWVDAGPPRPRYRLIGTAEPDYDLLPRDHGAYFDITASDAHGIRGTWGDGAYRYLRSQRGGRFCAERLGPPATGPGT